jgi:hypothetical protein
MPLTETPVVPVFVTQTTLSALVVPRVTEPKARLESGSEKEVTGAGGAVIVTETVADLVASAALVAVTVAVVLALTVGAVWSPVLEIVPRLAVQVTAVLVVPVTVAVNC